jgi:hypothetical protein
VTLRFSHLLLALTVGLTLNGCGSAKVADVPPTVMPPYAEVASYKLQIDVRDGQCILNYNGPFRGQVETGIPAPCQFLRDSVGNIQHMELKNTTQNGGGTYSVILIIGGPHAIDGRTSKNIQGCGSESLPISLSPRGIALGAIGTGLDICPTDRVDEKLFTADSRHV